MYLKVYIYPNIARQRMGSQNPYVEDLKQALLDNGFRIEAPPAQKAFVDLLSKGMRNNAVVLNWIEDIPSRRMGFIQTFLLTAYLRMLKLRGVKIIWIKHNRLSHERQGLWLKKYLHKVLVRRADHIITHARNTGLPESSKLLYLHHPNRLDLGSFLPSPETEPAIDFLIWGSIFPYKGILEFLEFVSKNESWRKYRIRIIGKCSDAAYWRAMESYKTENIVMTNQFVEEQELHKLFAQTRFILFTYRKESILSSGVLIDSLIAGRRIIAPDCGAFADMAETDGFVSVYQEFADIARIYEAEYDNYLLDKEALTSFVLQNSWDKMGQRFKKISL
ncbi:MAG: glycosyltransferase family 4 protein [Bacteroidetes bacterium]|nr:glycosyltransferase family 4 protein [Bacteroidota bacterium]